MSSAISWFPTNPVHPRYSCQYPANTGVSSCHGRRHSPAIVLKIRCNRVGLLGSKREKISPAGDISQINSVLRSDLRGQQTTLRGWSTFEPLRKRVSCSVRHFFDFATHKFVILYSLSLFRIVRTLIPRIFDAFVLFPFTSLNVLKMRFFSTSHNVELFDATLD